MEGSERPSQPTRSASLLLVLLNNCCFVLRTCYYYCTAAARSKVMLPRSTAIQLPHRTAGCQSSDPKQLVVSDMVMRYRWSRWQQLRAEYRSLGFLGNNSTKRGNLQIPCGSIAEFYEYVAINSN